MLCRARLKESTATPRMRLISHTAPGLLSRFFSSHADPEGTRAPWGCKPHASAPNPHRTPWGTTAGPQGRDNKSPRASHVLLACNKTSSLPGQGGGTGQIKRCQSAPEVLVRPHRQRALGCARLLLMRWPGRGGLLWGLGLFLRARDEEKTRKLTFWFGFCFFFGPNRPQQFTGTQRHRERRLPFITQGRRLKARRGGEGRDPWSTTGVIAAGALQQKDLENIN